MERTNETHPNYPFMQGDDIFYGIEFETAIPTNNVVFAIGSHYKPTQVPHYPQGWKAGSDISIEAPIGYTAVEFVSPKMKGFDGIIQIVQVLDDLNERGAIVNSSTGLHIHVDGTNLDQRDIKKVVQMYVQYEKLFYGVLGLKAKGRYESSYCTPVIDWGIPTSWFSMHNGLPVYSQKSPVTEMYGGIPVTWFVKENGRVIYSGYSKAYEISERTERRRGLNLKNWYQLEKKKTIEFRLFAGELNPEKVITYLMMCVGLVVRARNCTRIHRFARPATDLKDLCKKFIANVLSKKTNQIVPEYTPERGDSLYKVLYENVPNSTVSL